MSGSQVQTQTYLVEIWLVSNPKTVRRKPFVARLDENGGLEFLRAVVPYFEKNTFIGGKYLVREGDILVIRSDDSTHKHEYTTYELCVVRKGELKTIARINIKDGTPAFEPPELEKVYAEVVSSGNTRNRYVVALVEYAKRRGVEHSEIIPV